MVPPKKFLSLFAFLTICGCLSLVDAEADDGKSRSKLDTKMLVQIEINRPSGGRKYRSPYVAVWLEDKDRFPVRTLALWLMTDQPGPRWHRDLRQWYKSDQMRSLVEDQNLIDGMSGPTRVPGKYKFGWDGNDNDGKPLPSGTYTLYAEAAREHGTYQLIKEDIEIGDRPFKKSLEGNIEIKAVELEYDPNGPAK